METIKNAPNLNLIFCLDVFSDTIIAYNINGEVQHSPRPTLSKVKHQMPDTYIISMFYSQYEKRIGTCNNDYSISFWEE